jgi:hypothetical protein
MTIIDGKWAVSGGQSSEVFIQVKEMESLFQNAEIFRTRSSRNLQPLEFTLPRHLLRDPLWRLEFAFSRFSRVLWAAFSAQQCCLS